MYRRYLSRIIRARSTALLLPLAGVAALVVFPLVSSNGYWIRNISLIAILALVVSGINLSFGYAGEVQFGQVFMFALGGYAAAIVGTHTTGEIVPLLLVAGVIAAIVGGIVAVPALRFGGWSLALISFFLVITIPDITYIFQNQTGGFNGDSNIPIPTFFGRQLGTTALYYCAIICMVLWLTVFRNLVTSRYGVILRSMRESEVLSASLGFSKFRLKLIAYMLGAFPAGVAGCLYAFVTLILAPGAFGFGLAVAFVAASIIGGTESIYAVVFAAAILQLGPQQSASFQQYAPIFYGAFLVVAAVAFRKGIGGWAKALVRRTDRWLGGSEGHVLRIDEADQPADARTRPTTERHRTQVLSETLGAFPGGQVEAREITKSFGGAMALDCVSLRAEPGVVTGLIGSNGSGKTTLLNVICGYATPDSGSVTMGGAVMPTTPQAIARHGIARTFQTPIIPAGVSVLDVVASGRFARRSCGLVAVMFRLPRYWRTRREEYEAARSVLELVGLSDLADQEAASLPLGLRRLLEVARVLCGQPGAVLLDEPASGLSRTEIERLIRAVRAAADAGAAVLLIEHNFAFVAEVCDSVFVLDSGSLIASGTADDVVLDPRVVESYLGELASEVEAVEGSAPAPVGALSAVAVVSSNGSVEASPVDVVLRVSDLVSGYGDLQVLHGISLDIQRGGVEVILGRNGAGKTTLLHTIAGELSLWQGSLSLDGTEIGKRSAHTRARAGVALVQEGKRIFRERTVWENLMIGTIGCKLGRYERRQRCESVIEQFPMLRERSQISAGSLSGGQQQMLAIAQALASQPEVLLLDEPSAGLAPAVVSEVFARLHDLAATGDLTIVLTEQLAEKALAIARHVTVMDGGQVVASGPPAQFADLRELQAAYFASTK